MGHTISKKIGAIVFTLAIAFPLAASADTLSDLQAQLQALMERLTNLQTQQVDVSLSPNTWPSRPLRSPASVDNQQVSFGANSAAVSSWTRKNFTKTGANFCEGNKYVGYSTRYGMWVGAQLCGSTSKYKLYMSSSENGTYHQIGDTAGNGEDHCELVNPTFTLPDEDNIKSGTCSTCALADTIDVVNQKVYSRSRLGEPFELTDAVDWGDLTVRTYSCGESVGSTNSSDSWEGSNTSQTLDVRAVANALTALEQALLTLQRLLQQ